MENSINDHSIDGLVDGDIAIQVVKPRKENMMTQFLDMVDPYFHNLGFRGFRTPDMYNLRLDDGMFSTENNPLRSKVAREALMAKRRCYQK